MKFNSVWVGFTVAALMVGCGGSPGGVGQPNAGPVGSAGLDQTVATTSQVLLAGSGSDANGDAITFAWTLTKRPDGSQATLTTKTEASTNFIADVDGVYVAELMVSDGKAASAASTVTITATNTAPVAAAGPEQSVVTGTLVLLDGSRSTDANRDSLTYRWTLSTKPTGSATQLNDGSAAQPSFSADLSGVYEATLVVSDGKAESAPATVRITSTVANAAPVADAGPAQSVVAGSVITLDGTASSDANGDVLTYAWVLTTRPGGSAANLDQASVAKPIFTADLPGRYVAALVVNDGRLSSGERTVTVNAAVANAAPIANAGQTQTVVAGGSVTLDGSASSDANGDPLTYAWTMTSKPAGSIAALGVTSSRPVFVADLPGTYIASLVVSDGRLSSPPSSVSVVASGIPFDNFVGARDAIASGMTTIADAADMTVSTSPTTLTVKLKQFFDGTCIYTATLTATRDGVGSGTYTCSDLTSGVWELLEMKWVEQEDIYLRLKKDGVLKRVYGISATTVVSVKTLPDAIGNLVGTYQGLATGGPFGTEPASSIKVAVTGTSLQLTVTRFFSGTCQYNATIQADGRSVTGATYQCSDFSTGSWTLTDMKSVGGSDLYVALKADGFTRRAYGFK